MDKLKKYNEFVNEGLFKNFVGMAMRSIGSWAAEPLNDMMKDIKQSGDPKKIINSLKTYIQKSGESIKKQLVDVKSIGDTKDDENSLFKFLYTELFGLYTAIKGVQATQKVNNTYFNEIFKKADKNFVKAMSAKEKKASGMIEAYIKTLIGKDGSFNKIAGITESKIYEELDTPNTQKVDEDPNAQKVDPNTQKDTKEEEPKEDENLTKLKGVTQKWLTNILSPIMNSEAPKGEKGGEEGDIIPTVDKSQVRRDVVQDMVKNSSIRDLQVFRNRLGKKQGLAKDSDELKSKWPVGK